MNLNIRIDMDGFNYGNIDFYGEGRDIFYDLRKKLKC